MDAVRCFEDKSQNKWEEHLPQLASAIRSSVNRHTGFTPNKRMLGREVSTPADLVFRPPETNPSMDHDEYVPRLKETIWIAHEVANDVLQY